jgi:hypothetical protein
VIEPLLRLLTDEYSQIVQFKLPQSCLIWLVLNTMEQVADILLSKLWVYNLLNKPYLDQLCVKLLIELHY